MADKNIRLVNPQKFDVGIKTFDRPTGMNIEHGSFIMVSEEEINYLASISDVLQKGILRIENGYGAKEDVAGDLINTLGIDTVNDPNFADNDDIRKHLSMSAKKIEEWLNGIEEKFMLDRIYDIAMEMSDKMTAPKIKVLSAKMPDRDFIGE